MIAVSNTSGHNELLGLNLKKEIIGEKKDFNLLFQFSAVNSILAPSLS